MPRKWASNQIKRASPLTRFQPTEAQAAPFAASVLETPRARRSRHGLCFPPNARRVARFCAAHKVYIKGANADSGAILVPVFGQDSTGKLEIQITKPEDESTVSDRPLITGNVSDPQAKVWVLADHRR